MTDQAEQKVAVRAEGVSIRFGGVQALDSVGFEARAGEVTGLIGPNGAGKSTILACISGVARQNSGRIWIDGHEVTRASPQRRASYGLARTFQSPQLVTELTVREHVVLAMRSGRGERRGILRAVGGVLADFVPFISRGIRKSELTKADELIDSLELGPDRDKGPSELTLGKRRLLEVAICLATEAKVMLLDEPSAGLNADETLQLGVVIAEVAKDRGIAVVLVEHDLSLVFSISARIYVLDFGILIDSGTPAEMRASRAVQAAYLGTATEDTAEEEL